MNLNEIYTDTINDHSRSGHNKHHLDGAVCERGHNPSCGDDITLELVFDGDSICDAAFEGSGCAISQASTSIMIDLIKGRTIEEALHLTELFLGMIRRENKDDALLEEELQEAYILKNISNMPARVKCAVLAWHTLKQAIGKNTVAK